MLKISKTIAAILAISGVLCFMAIFLYFTTIVDSVVEIIVLSVLALFCCRILYLLIRDLFKKTEYIEVVNKMPAHDNNTSKKKNLYSAKCVINGKERTLYFKSKDDYFKVSNNNEYLMKRSGNRIIEVK